jgi:predicted ATP-grasp superfamily ATP-dependent carboligase
MKVILLSLNPLLGQVVLDALRANNVTSWLIYDQITASMLRYSRLTTVLMGGDALANRTEEIVSVIDRCHQEHHIDMVLASDVEGLLILTDIRDRIAPPVYAMPDRGTLGTLNNKWQFYQLCQDLDLPVPKSRFFTAKTLDVAEIERDIGFPLVIKPTEKSGSIGVRTIHNSNELRKVLGSYNFEEFVVQKYIAGDDIGLSVLALQGVIQAVTCFWCGSRLATRFDSMPDFVELCRRILLSTTFTGVANFDARIEQSTGTIRLLECNPRFFARLNAVRHGGLDFLRLVLYPGEKPGAANGIVFARGDIRAVRALLDSPSRAIVVRTWHEYFQDPLPRLLHRIRGNKSNLPIQQTAPTAANL